MLGLAASLLEGTALKPVFAVLPALAEANAGFDFGDDISDLSPESVDRALRGGHTRSLSLATPGLRYRVHSLHVSIRPGRVAGNTGLRTASAVV